MRTTWPQNGRPYPYAVISPFHNASIASVGGSFGAPASTAWPAANRAIFVPFRLVCPITVTVLAVYNGVVVPTGNTDIGIYSDDGPGTSTATKIVSSGSTATAGSNAIQTFNITDTLIGPGNFYLAMALDNGTDAIFRSPLSNVGGRSVGVAQMAAAFALPASATLAAYASTYIPVMGFSSDVRTFV